MSFLGAATPHEGIQANDHDICIVAQTCMGRACLGHIVSGLTMPCMAADKPAIGKFTKQGVSNVRNDRIPAGDSCNSPRVGR